MHEQHPHVILCIKGLSRGTVYWAWAFTQRGILKPYFCVCFFRSNKQRGKTEKLEEFHYYVLYVFFFFYQLRSLILSMSGYLIYDRQVIFRFQVRLTERRWYLNRGVNCYIAVFSVKSSLKVVIVKVFYVATQGSNNNLEIPKYYLLCETIIYRVVTVTVEGF